MKPDIERISEMIKIKAKEQLHGLLSFQKENRSFIEFELEICRSLNEIGATILQEAIPIIYGNGYKGSKVEIDEETIYSCISRQRERGLLTAFGKIKISRSVYTDYYSGGIKSFLDEELDIENKKHCPLIKYWSDVLGTVAPFEEASDTLNKLRGISISRKQVENSTESMGEKISKRNIENISPVLLDKEGKISASSVNLNLNSDRTIYIETDGCHINTKDGWKECKTFMLFEIEKLDEKTQKLKNKYYYSTMGDISELKRQLKFHLERYCGDEEVRIICIGDGAKWIWNTIEELFPKDKFHSGIIGIIDWYHAVEKIGEMFSEILPTNQSSESYLEQYKKYLKKGNIEIIEQELTMLMNKQNDTDKQNKINETIRYFTNNKEKMRYDKYKGIGLCIGSGAIESANKYVVQRRIKLQGMRWEKQNANYMAHLRAEYINGSLEKNYNINKNPFLDNVVVT